MSMAVRGPVLSFARHTCILASIYGSWVVTGDHAFLPFTAEPGNPITDKYFSLHIYLWGGRSHVSRHHKVCHRAARPAKAVDHGCLAPTWWSYWGYAHPLP
mmetsp:Transcript_28789/g.41228  ORF Transcript_28789/g.41228 Transcript_28789/m.41228 type:complete len:101 (+) Transcript_28789:288-590(+)